MLRQLITFAPASVAPALLSFGFVLVFTRSLTPDNYRIYTLVSSVMMFLLAVVFWPLASAMVRFYPEAEKTSQVDSLLKTGYSMFAVGTALVLGVSVLVALLPIDAVMWFVVPLLAVRSGSNLSLALGEFAGNYGRYNAMVLIENVVGFLAAIALVRMSPSASSLLLGLCIGSLCCVVVYGPWVLRAYRTGRIRVLHGRTVLGLRSSYQPDLDTEPVIVLHRPLCHLLVRRWPSACDLRRGVVARGSADQPDWRRDFDSNVAAGIPGA